MPPVTGADDFTGLLDAAASEAVLAGPTDALGSAVKLATQIVEHCDVAGVSLLHRDRWVDTPFLTDEVLRLIDEEQFALAEGPCIDAEEDSDTVISNDLATDSRWPTWGPRVVEQTGMRSCVCFRLFTGGRSLGALSLYSRTPHGFTSDDVDHGLALAAQIAFAFQSLEDRENFQKGMRNRTLIGQAVGMLMERYELDPDAAFGVLARLSSHLNIKLIDIAREVVTTGELPTVDHTRP
jgi:GAF domain-containing protein